jgi:hypothetical protein
VGVECLHAACSGGGSSGGGWYAKDQKIPLRMLGGGSHSHTTICCPAVIRLIAKGPPIIASDTVKRALATLGTGAFFRRQNIPSSHFLTTNASSFVYMRRSWYYTPLFFYVPQVLSRFLDLAS